MAIKSNNINVITERMLNRNGEYEIIYKRSRADLIYRENTTDTTVEDTLKDYDTHGVKSYIQNSSGGYYTNFPDVLAHIDFAEFDQLSADTGFFDSLTARTVTADAVNTQLLHADAAAIDYLTSKIVTADTINAQLLNADQASIDFLTSKTVTSDSVLSQLVSANLITSDKTITDEAIAQKATLIKGIAKELTVADLSAGDITVSDKMRIVSENGAMVMDGTKLQISGKYVDTDGKQKSYVGVQLGYDTSNQPSLILRNPQGAVVLSPDGITKDAIADGLIDNDMVKDNSLSKDKLGFDIIEPNEYGGIDIAKVYDGNGNQFGVEYTSFKNNTADKLEQLDTDIQNSQTYQVYIDTPNGTNIGTGEITLKAKLMKNSEDVTDQFDAKYFIWERKSNDADADLYWNDQHSTGAKSIQVTANDVKINAVFQCRFEKNE